MQDVHGGRHPIGEMVQARAFAVGKREVVHIAFPMQPRGSNTPAWPVFLGIFRQSEAEPGVEVEGILNLGRENIEMVEPLRVTSPVEVVTAEQKRALLHRCTEFDLEAEGVGELQRAALKRLLRKSANDAALGKKCRRLVEILLVADLETKAIAGGVGRLAQDQRVM